MRPSGTRRARQARALVALVSLLLSLLPITPARAQNPPPAPSATLEVLGVEQSPGNGTVAVRIRANGNRDARVEQVSATVDSLPARIVSPSMATSVAERPAVLLLIDSSGSMAGAPLASAVAAARSLVGRLATNDVVGLTSFASSVTAKAPLTAQRSSVEAGISQLAAIGDTALYDAVIAGVNTLRAAPGSHRILVLLSDGQDSGASKASRDAAIDAARKSDITIYAVGLGAEADSGFLRTLSDVGHGTYWSVNGNNLPELFTALGGRIGATETVEISTSGLASGRHEMVLRGRIGNVAVQTTVPFELRTDSAMALQIMPPSVAEQPIVVALGGAPGAGSSIDALLDGKRAGVTIDGDRLLIDPWEVAPGDHRLDAQVSSSGVVISRGSTTVSVPTLAPRLTVSTGARANTYVAVGRAQGVTTQLRASASDREIGRSSTSLEFAAPDQGGQVMITLHDSNGATLAAHTLDLPVPRNTRMFMIAGAGLAVIVVAALVIRRRSRRPAAAAVRAFQPHSHRALSIIDPTKFRGAPRRQESATVAVRDGDGHERTYEISERPLTAGSAPDCDIHIVGDEVRQHHATFSATAAGELRVHGLAKQSNSPFEQRIDDMWIVMQSGDEISIGQWVFRLTETAEQRRRAGDG